MTWQTHSSTHDEKVRQCASCRWQGFHAGGRCPSCNFPLEAQELRPKLTPLNLFALQRDTEHIGRIARYHRRIAARATEGGSIVECPGCGRAMPEGQMSCTSAEEIR